jgi:hypothetical protein
MMATARTGVGAATATVKYFDLMCGRPAKRTTRPQLRTTFFTDRPYFCERGRSGEGVHSLKPKVLDMPEAVYLFVPVRRDRPLLG